MDLMILKQEMPKIEVNFEEVKENLQHRLADYSKLVVTEETLGFCKSEQKHLAGLRKKVDDYRKDIKREMSIPVKVFEDKCKELIDLIAETEKPIKEGIDVFDEKRREEKRQFALIEIERVSSELMLSPKYQGKIQLLPAYCNLTAKEKEVSESIYNQVELLLKQQEQEDLNKKLIENACYKARPEQEIDIMHYVRELERSTIFEILEQIEKSIEKFNKAMDTVKEQVKEEIKQEVKPIAQIDTNNTMTYTLKLTATKNKLMEVRKLIVALGIEYEVVT